MFRGRGGGLEDRVLVASPEFCLAQRLVGALEQAGAVDAVVGEFDTAEADLGLQNLRVDLDGFAQRVEQFDAEAADVVAADETGRKQNEIVGTEAREGVGFPDGCCPAPGKFAQQAITDEMPMVGIESAEFI